MINGYKVYWTDNALGELKETILYLQENFTDRELRKLALSIEKFVNIISRNPYAYPLCRQTGVYRAVVLKFNNVYYKIEDNRLIILSFFSNRQHPRKDL